MKSNSQIKLNNVFTYDSGWSLIQQSNELADEFWFNSDDLFVFWNWNIDDWVDIVYVVNPVNLFFQVKLFS